MTECQNVSLDKSRPFGYDYQQLNNTYRLGTGEVVPERAPERWALADRGAESPLANGRGEWAGEPPTQTMPIQ
jgi:hypothetical protein